ncbi:MAG TPA: hypothetical protein VMD79_10355 [Solirubrobacteraceae bacterium]|nr:hypothetical protein [Solirubrobacteraceae bacterium]
MTNSSLTSDPPDICLILRAHAEQLWLTAQVIPTVRSLEHPHELHADHVGAALAYLEVLWLEACQRAVESDAALAELLDRGAGSDRCLYEKARRYHVAVRRLRTAVAQRVGALNGTHGWGPQRPPMCDRRADAPADV